MRGHRTLWRPVVALLVTLVVALSAVGCDPSPSTSDLPTAEEASGTQAVATAPATAAPTEAPAAAKEIVKTFGHGDTFRKSTPAPDSRTTTSSPLVKQEASPTRPPVEVLVTQPPVEIEGAETGCLPEWDRPEWLFRDFVQWTPDGSTVLFTDGPHIYAVAADGSRLWSVVVPNPPEGKQAWPMAPFTISSDSEHVVFATCEYGRSYEIARVGVDGTQPQQLTVNSRSEYHPAWSPDGARIAYLAAARVHGGASELRPRLYTMAPDGSDVRPVRTAADAEPLHLPPQWSPDSKHLAYAQREVGGGVGLYTVAVDGNDPPQRLAATVSAASWSPDGTRIAFAKPEPDTVSLFTIAVGGWDAQRVRTIPLNHWRPRPGYMTGEPSRAWIETVSWSPDGSKILYSCGGTCVVDLDDEPVANESPSENTSSAQDDLDPLPGGKAAIPRTVEHGNVAAWSPDGLRIAISLVTADTGPGDVMVYSVAADGDDVQVLVRAGAGGHPVAAQSGYQAACAAGTAVTNPESNSDLVRDCATLLRVRDALGGTAELNWTPNRPIDEWDGLHLGGLPRRLISISLNRRGLAGQIPTEFGELTHLRYLELSETRLGGEIPPELGQLAPLARLDLSGNSLTGGIPRELGALSHLVALDSEQQPVDGSNPAGSEPIGQPGDDLPGRQRPKRLHPTRIACCPPKRSAQPRTAAV